MKALLCSLALSLLACGGRRSAEPNTVITSTDTVYSNILQQAMPTAPTQLRDSLVVHYAMEYSVDPELALAVSHVENPMADSLAVSRAGAVGLMQVMPSWYAAYPSCGYDLNSSSVNVCYGVRILRYYLDACQEDLPCALARYNGAVTPWKAALYVSQVNAKLEGSD